VESEAIPPKPPRTPEEEAAHRLKKAGKKAAKEKKKGEKRERRRLRLIAITLSVFLAWLGSTLFEMFHSSLARELGATSRVNRPGQLLGGPHHDRGCGRTNGGHSRPQTHVRDWRPGLLCCRTLGLTVTNVGSLVVVRALMGLSAGLVLTATGGILVSTMHGTTRHDAWLLWRGAGMAGMVLGPVIGPLIAFDASWRRLFIADALLMLVAVGLGVRSMKEIGRDVFTFTVLLSALLLGLGLLSPTWRCWRRRSTWLPGRSSRPSWCPGRAA
jgi:MFS family permease